MKFHVRWTRDARRQLAAIWVNRAKDRQAVTAAQAQIDRLLALDPLSNGIQLSEGLYAIVVEPLRVIFEISEQSQKVTVESAKWSP